MSFQIHIGLIGASVPEARAMAQHVRAAVPLCVTYDRWVTLLGSPALVVGASEGDREANALLSDDADWNAEQWALRPEVLALLGETVTRIYSASSTGIAFRALWISDRADRRVDMTVTELSRTIARNGIPNRTVIVVRKGPGHAEVHQ